MAQLKQLGYDERRNYEAKAMVHLLPLLGKANSIAVYHASGTEFDLHEIIQFCIKNGKQLYQPVAKRESRLMYLEPFNQNKPEIFSHPLYVPSVSAEWYNLDLILLPLVAVDEFGYRLGIGGGYYDTTLAALADLPHPIPKLCGIGYSCQLADCELPHESFDVRLDYFVSEDGLISFKGK